MPRRNIFLTVLLLLTAVTVRAQIPYFASTAGDGQLYGYTSVKVRPGINMQETYTCFQYGIGNQWAAGADIYAATGGSYWGALVRWGRQFSPYIGVGAQVTPSFSLDDTFSYRYTTAALYLNGNIVLDGRLFWCSNSWWSINRDGDDTITNWEFLGINIPLPKGTLTPMAGMTHDWTFSERPDMSAGFYYSLGHWCFYLWGNDYFRDHPRVVVGIDFKI